MYSKGKQFGRMLGSAALLLGLSAPIHASFLTGIITPGANDFEDQSREVFIDNGDGLLGVGDILTGFNKIDDRTMPNPVDLENHVYAIFSQEDVSIAGPNLAELGPVTSNPSLTLSALGVPGAGPQDLVALFSSEITPTGFSVDLILDSPGDRTGNGTTTLADYLDLIVSEGTLDILAGIYETPSCSGASPSDMDCFQATGVLTGGGPTGQIIDAPANIQFGGFLGGLSVSLDPAPFTIEDVTPSGIFAPSFPAIAISEFAISNGAARGTLNAVNAAEWIDASELTSSPQCISDTGTSVPCGFVDDADFGFFAAVPEPTTIAMLGAGLLGLGAARRRRVVRV